VLSDLGEARELGLRPRTIDREGSGNLVANLAGVIRDQIGPETFVPEVTGGPGRDEGLGGLSLDAISAAVRERVSGWEIVIREDTVASIAGALTMAMVTAHRPANAEAWEGDSGEAIVVAPWEVTHPVLLDPLMWMWATAYTSP
jgi:hypothetical protein